MTTPNPSPQAAEPTMEEILASIRRIISEEGQDAPKAAEPEPAAVAAAPEPEPDVLELTEVVEEMYAEPEPAAAPEPAYEHTVVELKPAPRYEPPQEYVQPAPPPPRAAPPVQDNDLMLVDREMPKDDHDTLLSTDVADRMSSVFGQLERNLTVSSEPGRSLEDMVRSLLKPMLKQWLDEHLPDTVDRIVREEVERVTRRGRKG